MNQIGLKKANLHSTLLIKFYPLHTRKEMDKKAICDSEFQKP